MANDLSKIIPKVLAQGLLALRENVVMPAVVNSDYSDAAASKGATIDVPIPSAIAAVPVVPAPNAPTTADVSPTSVPIQLSEWYEAPFYLTDKDKMEAISGVLPMQASEAIKALANNVNSYIMSKYKGVYNAVGTPGVSPLSADTTDATNARKVLSNNAVPLTDRRFVINPDAEANALNLRAFQDMSFSGSASEIRDGKINQKLGFAWFMDQQIPYHTKGTATGYLVNGTPAVGATSIPVDTGTGTFVIGDLITFAGDTQTYAVLANHAGGAGNLSITPGLKLAPADNAVISIKDSHVVNLAFHRDAFAFATRPLEDEDQEGLGSRIQSAVDPVSGLALRLEVTREHKRQRWSFDILYGAELVRKELATRVFG